MHIRTDAFASPKAIDVAYDPASTDDNAMAFGVDYRCLIMQPLTQHTAAR